MFNVRDQLIYVLIGLAVVGGVFWSVTRGVPNDSFSRWGGLAIYTAWLFGLVIQQSRDLWRNRVFWFVTCTLFSVHTMFFVELLRNFEHWRMIWFLPTYPIELFIVVAVTELSIERSREKRHKHLQRTNSSD